MRGLEMALGLAGGVVLMLGVILLAACCQLALSEPPGQADPGETPYLICSCERVPLIGGPLAGLFRRLHRWDPKPFHWLHRIADSWGSRVLKVLQRWMGPGYLVENRRPLALESGHLFALALAFLTFLVYAGIGIGKYVSIVRMAGGPKGQAPSVPSLVFLLFGLTGACWLFSALTFFWDRHRVPVLIVFFAGLCLVTAWMPQSDHFYRVEPRILKQATPGQVLARKGPRPVVVAAAGGGIQAAAWTTQVLWGLDQESKGALRSSLAAVSGVSGGSVGAMFFGAHLEDGDLRAAALQARQSSLDEVAWGMLVADARRMVFPWLGGWLEDRGWALEQSWRARARPLDAWLSQWAERAHRDFPAFLFNATVVESGKAYVFSTTAFQFTKEDWPELARLGGDGATDIPVTTAVRLSATFPVVSPAARPDTASPAQRVRHLVDGGYYDNSGVQALLVWLDEALEELGGSRPRQILIVKIEPFPPSSNIRVGGGGWLDQLLAPVRTVLRVRESSQMAQGSRQTELFRDKWQSRGVKVIDVSSPYTGVGEEGPECDEQPLSWKLSERQGECIDEVWKGGLLYGQFADILGYLKNDAK
jgi:predicted acylesterase/phospholipase RssA